MSLVSTSAEAVMSLGATSAGADVPLSRKAITERTAVIGVVGLGYVGLPLAVAFAETGFHVIGFDMQETRRERVNQGDSYVVDLPGERIRSAVSAGRLETASDNGRIRDVDAVCVCVPTPLTESREPDLTYVVRVCEDLAAHQRQGQLIVLESTTYPGTTRDVVLPILERSGLKGEVDFYLAYSPERVDPGNRDFTIKNTPKLVGGIGPASTELAELLYQQVADNVVTVSGPEVAEMAKVFENVFRSVNIALVNEMARLCEVIGTSVWEVIAAASSKPFGYVPFSPGVGTGGHCIPLDPYYLASKARRHDFHVRFIELASDVNEQMPYHVASRIVRAVNDQGKAVRKASVFVLGAAYKKNVDDTRESPSVKLMEILGEMGASVYYNDPYVSSCVVGGTMLTSVELSAQSLSEADCVVVAADHADYDCEYIVAHASLVFDATGATKGLDSKNITRLGE